MAFKYKLNPKALEIIKTGSDNERKYLFEKHPIYFAINYFPNAFEYPMANFHYDFIDDWQRANHNELDEIIWCVHREGAKTSWAKMLVVHDICFENEEYINVDAEDKGNAEQFLFDVAMILQTNQKLIKDFGNLYNEKSTKDQKTKKRIGDFLTSNNIRVEAHSTQTTTRGRQFWSKSKKTFIRPTKFIFDDIETYKTTMSRAKTEQNLKHVDEALSGLAPNATVVILCNKISDDGVITSLMDTAKGNKRAVVRDIPVVVDGKILWDGKYCFTDEEAEKTGKVSLESKKRTIKNYQAEMMNNPSDSKNAFFDIEKIDEALKHCIDPKEEIAGLKIWDTYKPHHRYAIGGDTSAGVERDANAMTIIDFTGKAIVGTYANNTIAPDIFGHEMIRAGNMFGRCLLAPEINNTGYATISTLKNENYRNVFKRNNGQIGWMTGQGNKNEMLYQFKKAFEDGELKIYDKDLLMEMKYYKRTDLQSPEGRMVTKHFDLLMSACIGWAMSEYAGIKESSDSFWDSLD